MRSGCAVRDATDARRRLAHHGAGRLAAPLPRRASTGRGSRSCGTTPTRTRRRRRCGRTRDRRCTAIRSTAPRTQSQITLRKNFLATGSFLERRPAARARPARLREPARVRHVHEPARVALRPRRRPRRSRSRSRAAQHRADARLVLGRSAPAAGTRRAASATCAAAVALDARGDRRRAAPRSGSGSTPAGPLAESRRRSNRCGRCARRRECRSCCTSPARART